MVRTLELVRQRRIQASLLTKSSDEMDPLLIALTISLSAATCEQHRTERAPRTLRWRLDSSHLGARLGRLGAPGLRLLYTAPIGSGEQTRAPARPDSRADPARSQHQLAGAVSFAFAAAQVHLAQ